MDPKQTLPSNTGNATGFSNVQGQDTILEWQEISSDKRTTQFLQIASWNSNTWNL